MKSPRRQMMVGPMKLTALIKLDEQDKALDYARRARQVRPEQAGQGLNGLAWAIVDPDAGIKPSAKLIEFAVETARRADEKAEARTPRSPTRWPRPTSTRVNRPRPSRLRNAPSVSSRGALLKRRSTNSRTGSRSTSAVK